MSVKYTSGIEINAHCEHLECGCVNICSKWLWESIWTRHNIRLILYIHKSWELYQVLSVISGSLCSAVGFCMRCMQLPLPAECMTFSVRMICELFFKVFWFCGFLSYEHPIFRKLSQIWFYAQILNICQPCDSKSATFIVPVEWCFIGSVTHVSWIPSALSYELVAVKPLITFKNTSTTNNYVELCPLIACSES